jgi:hypothetical protein
MPPTLPATIVAILREEHYKGHTTKTFFLTNAQIEDSKFKVSILQSYLCKTFL